jgi:hypothetical protein
VRDQLRLSPRVFSSQQPAPVLAGVKVVRSVGRSTLTPAAGRRAEQLREGAERVGLDRARPHRCSNPAGGTGELVKTAGSCRRCACADSNPGGIRTCAGSVRSHVVYRIIRPHSTSDQRIPVASSACRLEASSEPMRPHPAITMGTSALLVSLKTRRDTAILASRGIHHPAHRAAHPAPRGSPVRELRHWASTIAGATSISQVEARTPCKVAGVVQNIRIDPRRAPARSRRPSSMANGQMIAKWLGRCSACRHHPGA